MPIELYKEPVKEVLTADKILKGFEIYASKAGDCWSIKYKNQVIFKSCIEPTEKEVKEYLQGEGKNLLKKFMEKVKLANEKRISSIKERNDKIKEIKEDVKYKKIREKYEGKK